MACHEQPPEQLYNQYYNLTEWKIRNFCGKYKIEYGTDIGLQNVRRAPPWKVQVCGSSPSASPGSPTFSRRCLIIAKLLQIPIVSNTFHTYCLKYLQHLLSQILAIPIVCWVREKSAATPDTSGRSRPISAYFASESSLALGKWQNCESNRKKNQIQTLHTWPQGQAFVEVIWTSAESKSGQKMRKIIETRACVIM